MTEPRQLRPYQAEAVTAVIDYWATPGRDRYTPAVVSPVGSGKSTMLAKVAVEARQRGLRVVMLAHRRELLDQMAATVAAVAPDLPAVGIVQGQRHTPEADIVAASFQTLTASPSRLAELGRRDIVLVDEAHHAPSETYKAVLDDLGVLSPDPDNPVFACGFTATASRADGGLGEVWDKVVFERSLSWAIKAGYLVTPRGLTVVLPDMDLSKVTVRAGDYAAGELEHVMQASVDTTVAAMLTHAAGRASIVFAAGVDHAEALATALTANGVRAAAVTGAMSSQERAKVYADFTEARLDAMVTVQVLTEGADFPRCDAVVMARPTRSQTLYCFDEQTEILTDQGWVSGTDVRDGARVAAYYVDTGKIEWEEPQRWFVRPLEDDERMVSLSSPTVDMRVTENHRMVWKGKKGDSWRASEARDLITRKSAYRMPFAGVQDTDGLELTDDEIRFVAWVMTDGYVRKDGALAGITQQDPENRRQIESVLDSCGFKWNVTIDSSPTNFGPRKNPLHNYYVCRGKPRGAQYQHLRGWDELGKYVPKYSGSSAYDLLGCMDARQWSIFLDVFHRANGAKQANAKGWTRRGYHLFTPSKEFADWTQSMCVRRGWRCNVALDTAGRDKPLYAIHCREAAERFIGGSGQTDREHLEWSPTEPDEQVWCVTVSTGATVVRRNGKSMVSGNCQMVGRAVRLYPGKTDALVLDLAGVTRDMSLVTLSDLTTESVTARVSPTSTDDPGQEEPTPKPERKQRIGVADLEHIDLLAVSPANWLTTPKGVRFLDVGNKALVFLWPPHPDAATAVKVGVMHTPPAPGDGWLASGATGTLAEATEAAENAAGTYGKLPPRACPWRSRSAPSQAQVNLAKSLGVADADDKTRARLSDDISTALAAKRLDPFVN